MPHLYIYIYSLVYDSALGKTFIVYGYEAHNAKREQMLKGDPIIPVVASPLRLR